MEINDNWDVVETDNEEIFVNAAKDAPPPQDYPTTTTTTAAAAKEGRDDKKLWRRGRQGKRRRRGGLYQGGGGGGGDPAAEGGNNEYDKDDNEEDVMDFLSPLVARRVERLKCLITERERVMEQYLEDRATMEIKYLDTCKPLYEDRGNVVAGRLD